MEGVDHFFFFVFALSDAVIILVTNFSPMEQEPRGVERPTTAHRAVVIGPDLGVDSFRAQYSCSMTT